MLIGLNSAKMWRWPLLSIFELPNGRPVIWSSAHNTLTL